MTDGFRIRVSPLPHGTILGFPGALLGIFGVHLSSAPRLWAWCSLWGLQSNSGPLISINTGGVVRGQRRPGASGHAARAWGPFSVDLMSILLGSRAGPYLACLVLRDRRQPAPFCFPFSLHPSGTLGAFIRIQIPDLNHGERFSIVGALPGGRWAGFVLLLPGYGYRTGLFSKVIPGNRRGGAKIESSEFAGPFHGRRLGMG